MSVVKAIDEAFLKSKYEEVRNFQRIENEAALEIGRILYELKCGGIPDGTWTEFIESIGYNARTARRYVQVYEQFHNVPAAREVSFSKLAELLPLAVDVDRSDFLNQVKDESVRNIRAKVKEVSSRGKTQSEEIKTIERSKKINSDKVRVSVTSLENLIPWYVNLFEISSISIETAIKIGGFSKQKQELLYEIEQVDIRLIETRDDVISLINADFTREDILKCMSLIIDVVGESSMYMKVDDMLQEMYETMDLLFSDGDLKALYRLLIKFEERVMELDREYAARGTRIEFVYQEKLFGEFENGGKSEKSNHSQSVRQPRSTNVKQVLGVADDADVDAVKKQYRQLVKVLHPDVGGSPYLFQLVKDAYDEFREEIA